MFGIIVIGHANFSKELVSATEQILGPQLNIRAVAILPEDEAEVKRQELGTHIDALQQQDGLIILTDMFGGTPSNLAMSFLESENIEVIAGVNLPMLIKLLSVRSQHTLQKAAELAIEAGREYIVMASALLASNLNREVVGR